VALPDKPSFDRVDPSQPEHGDLRREYEDKLEALQAVDDLVAGLLAALEETGQAREHLVILRHRQRVFARQAPAHQEK
jgi:hypothetical protein